MEDAEGGGTCMRALKWEKLFPARRGEHEARFAWAAADANDDVEVDDDLTDDEDFTGGDEAADDSE